MNEGMAKLISEVIQQNTSIVELSFVSNWEINYSWSAKTCRDILHGLKYNSTITTCNLPYNVEQGTPFLVSFLFFSFLSFLYSLFFFFTLK